MNKMDTRIETEVYDMQQRFQAKIQLIMLQLHVCLGYQDNKSDKY